MSAARRLPAGKIDPGKLFLTMIDDFEQAAPPCVAPGSLSGLS